MALAGFLAGLHQICSPGSQLSVSVGRATIGSIHAGCGVLLRLRGAHRDWGSAPHHSAVCRARVGCRKALKCWTKYLITSAGRIGYHNNPRHHGCLRFNPMPFAKDLTWGVAAAACQTGGAIAPEERDPSVGMCFPARMESRRRRASHSITGSSTTCSCRTPCLVRLLRRIHDSDFPSYPVLQPHP